MLAYTKKLSTRLIIYFRRITHLPDFSKSLHNTHLKRHFPQNCLSIFKDCKKTPIKRRRKKPNNCLFFEKILKFWKVKIKRCTVCKLENKNDTLTDSMSCEVSFQSNQNGSKFIEQLIEDNFAFPPNCLGFDEEASASAAMISQDNAEEILLNIPVELVIEIFSRICRSSVSRGVVPSQSGGPPYSAVLTSRSCSSPDPWLARCYCWPA